MTDVYEAALKAYRLFVDLDGDKYRKPLNASLYKVYHAGGCVICCFLIDITTGLYRALYHALFPHFQVRDIRMI